MSKNIAPIPFVLRPVLLCGGSGTRLWPLSRTHYPKQFLTLTGEHSLLQSTVLRLRDLPNPGTTIAIANEIHRFLLAEQLLSLGETAEIVLEPAARNTAPAVAAAAVMAERDATDDALPLLLVLPSDHVIGNPEALRRAIDLAIPHALDGALVTFGVVPTRPETGYGYIRGGNALTPGVFVLDQFVEKPDADTARAYLAAGDYLWNSGMFLFRADAYVQALAEHAPEILRCAEQSVHGARHDVDFTRLEAAHFTASPSISIDYAVMEKVSNGIVVPLDAGWTDVGAWDAVAALNPADDAGNSLQGDVVTVGTSDSLLISDGQLLTAVGVSGLIVVATPDAVLVADKTRAQSVKELVDILKKQERKEADFRHLVHRPWGSFQSLANGPRYQVKRILVKPGAKISLQKHHHRAEHWVVVKGTAKIVCGDETLLLSENQSTYIPLGVVHRLENPGRIDLEIIEVQSGSYLGEDDIVRLEDHYGRQE